MRVLMLSKACLVGAYQRKLEEIAAAGVELTVVVPPEWRDERGTTRLERAHTRGYNLVVEPIALNGSFHLHFYPRLGRRLAEVRPEIVHLDEEPYNFATWHGLRLARRLGARVLFFSWQNLLRRYPPPFNWLERDVLRRADAGLAGNRAGQDVLRAKGYAGPLHLIPQFGVDPDIYQPAPAGSRRGFTVGYAGRLVPEKGVDLLLSALARLDGARLHIRGAGPAEADLRRQIAALGLEGRVRLDPLLPSTETPDFYRSLDCLALPSRSRPNWREQFGRVLIEGMACGLPVVGSDSGEIPNVVGQAGLIFAEDDLAALTAHLRALQADAGLRRELGELGRARVLEHYTQRQIAFKTVEVYRSLTL